jgi:hypothetical protein
MQGTIQKCRTARPGRTGFDDYLSFRARGAGAAVACARVAVGATGREFVFADE